MKLGVVFPHTETAGLRAMDGPFGGKAFCLPYAPTGASLPSAHNETGALMRAREGRMLPSRGPDLQRGESMKLSVFPHTETAGLRAMDGPLEGRHSAFPPEALTSSEE